MSDGLTLPETIHTIPEGLAFWAERTPHAPAIVSPGGRLLTHADLRTATAGVVSNLAALGITSEDRVALVLPGGADTATALLGIVQCAVAVPFNPAISAPELRRDLEHLHPRLLVAESGSKGAAAEVASSLGIATVTLADLVSDAAPPAYQLPLAPARPDDIAVILHTSGTTGAPKRIPRPHRTFLAGARAARLCTALTREDVALLPAGLHTNAGLVNLCAALLNGGSCVVMQTFDPAAYPEWLEMYGPTWTISTATELNLILHAADARGQDQIAGPNARLRIIRAGAQPMTPGTSEEAEARLGALIFDGFGMSEASYITGAGPDPRDRRPGSCGPPLLGEIRILDEQGEDLPAGMAGEVVIRGPTLFPGYLDDAEANAAAFLPGGWFRTGDLGALDEAGHLYLRGRRNELINRGGEKIAPAEVDHVLLLHPAVADAATFAVPDPRLGEDIVAAVVLAPGKTASPRELRAWMLDRLSQFKTPRRIWFVAALPRTATGKVQRGVLADLYARDMRRVKKLLPDGPRPGEGSLPVEPI